MQPHVKMPDITVAQIVAVVGAIIAVAVAFSVNITKEQQEAILALAGVVAGLLIHSDRKIRQHRAEMVTKVTALQNQNRVPLTKTPQEMTKSVGNSPTDSPTTTFPNKGATGTTTNKAAIRGVED